MHRVRLSAAALLLLTGPALADPYVPQDDTRVLLVLPTAHPSPAFEGRADPRRAAEEARRFMELARSTGDPRFLGYAEGWLQYWMDAASPPGSILLLRATVRQSRHDFRGALADLERLLAYEPGHAQAWLTRATLLRVQGRFPEAAEACARLKNLASAFVHTLCVESMRGCTGQLVSSARALEALTPASQRAPSAVRAWFAAERAEQAARLGRPAQALHFYRRAVFEGLGDPPLRAELADVLLDMDRAAEVPGVLGENPASELLSLRVTIAARRMGKPRPDLEEALADSYAAARRRGEDGHAREEARYLLDVRGDAKSALGLARMNWQQQREAADTRLLLRAARLARSQEDIAAVRDWLRETRFEDARLLPLLVEDSP